MKKALLVIDMQNISVGEKYNKFFKYNNEKIIREVNKVIDNNKENLVIYIENVMKRNLINKLAPFHAYEGTKDVELVKNLHIVSNNILNKYVGNAFSNPKLDMILKENDIDTVEVVGVDGGGCVSLTALGAIDKGYDVIVNETAIETMFIKNKQKYFKKLKNLGAKFIENE